MFLKLKEKKNSWTINCLKNTLLFIKFQVICTKKHVREKVKNEDQAYLIKEMLDRMKEGIKNVFKNRKFKIEENEKIIDIVERILYFNQLNQSGQGLKILTPNQMLSRLPISLAQLKAGNHSEKT